MYLAPFQTNQERVEVKTPVQCWFVPSTPAVQGGTEGKLAVHPFSAIGTRGAAGRSIDMLLICLFVARADLVYHS